MRLSINALGALLLVISVDVTAAPDWQQATPAIDYRAEGMLIEHEGEVFVLNGFTFGTDIQNTVEKYSVATNHWTQLRPTSVAAESPNAVTHNGLVKVGNEAWIIGGRIGDHPGRVSDIVWIYNLENDSWRRGPTLPQPFAGGGAAVVNNRIHVFGGFDRNAGCDVDSHFVYDLSNRSLGWQDITASAAMPRPRGHFATVVLDDLIYAIGGQHGHDRCATLANTARNVNLVHLYDPSLGQWRQLANLPFAQSHMEPSTFANNGIIYIVGGQAQGDKVLNYDPASNTWTIRSDLQLPTPLLAPGARIINNTLYVFGGGAPQVKYPVRTTYTLALNNSSAEDDVADDGSGSGSGAAETVFEQFDGTVIIDAQQFNTNLSRADHTWVSQSVGVKVLPDSGSIKRSTQLATSPQLSYKVNFSHSGKHYLWVRGLGDAINGEGKSDSLHVGLNGLVQTGSDKLDGFAAQWTWRRSTRDGPIAVINVPTVGLHDITVWMREDGLAVDKLLLTRDPDYQPVGSNPDATVGNGNGSDTPSDGNGTSGNTGDADDTDDTDGAPAQLEISTLDLEFGSVVVGESGTRQLRVKNAGSTVLTLSQVLVQGAAASSYRFVSAAPAQLASGEEIVVDLQFSPTDAGEHVAVLSLLHDPDSTLTLITLSGMATPVEDPETTGGSTGGAHANSRYFINAGGVDVIGTHGIVWSGDISAGVDALLASPTLTYSTRQTVATGADIDSLGAVPALFSTERYSANLSDMRWNFPVVPGDYQVHLFFAEIFAGAAQTNGRVFDIEIEGETLVDGLDVYSDAGSSHRALVRSFVISSDNNLSLTLLAIHQNPAIKAIAIVPCQVPCNTADRANRAPVADAGHDQQRVIGDVLSLMGQVSDDGLPNAQLISQWSQLSGPATVTFIESSNPVTTATFSAVGIYRLGLTANDGELVDQDEVKITIVDGQQNSEADFVEQNGRVLIEAEAYSQSQASTSHSWQLHNDTGAVQGLSMLSGPNLGVIAHTAAASPMLGYTVDFDSAGKRYVWIRGLGDSNASFEGKNDSLHAGLNGTLSQSADKIDHFPAHWSWTSHTRDGVIASIDIPSAGVHTVNVWMREDGLQIDQLYLTTQPGDIPETR